MYRAKEQVRAHYQLFDPAWQAQALERAELKRQLRLAVEKGAFQVYYQPVVDALGGTIIGAEALVLWPRPDGVVPPDRFIPVAEDLGLIQPLSMLIFQKALRQLRQWQGFRLAVDDFGTGYSSFQIVKRRPIHKLKIDHSFVRDLPGDIQDASIVEAVLAMAASLRLTVQAKGVETREQRDFLFSRPVPAGELELLLEMRDQWTMLPQ